MPTPSEEISDRLKTDAPYREGWEECAKQAHAARTTFGLDALDQCGTCKHFRYEHRYDGRLLDSECISCGECKSFVEPPLMEATGPVKVTPEALATMSIEEKLTLLEWRIISLMKERDEKAALIIRFKNALDSSRDAHQKSESDYRTALGSRDQTSLLNAATLVCPVCAKGGRPHVDASGHWVHEVPEHADSICHCVAANIYTLLHDRYVAVPTTAMRMQLPTTAEEYLAKVGFADSQAHSATEIAELMEIYAHPIRRVFESYRRVIRERAMLSMENIGHWLRHKDPLAALVRVNDLLDLLRNLEPEEEQEMFASNWAADECTTMLTKLNHSKEVERQMYKAFHKLSRGFNNPALRMEKCSSFMSLVEHVISVHNRDREQINQLQNNEETKG